MKYVFSYDGKMPSYIIQFIPFVDELEGTGTCIDRKTGHTVNIYTSESPEQTMKIVREVSLSLRYRRFCPRDAYFLEEEKEIPPVVNVYPILKCPIYEKLKAAITEKE